VTVKSPKVELLHALEALIGVQCWQIVAGRGTGSNFTLDLGQRRLRQRPLKNPTLSAAARRYEGEFTLYVQGPWRMHVKGDRIATWTDALDRFDVMVSGLDLMRGAHVERVYFQTPELKLRFEHGVTLVVFADEPRYAANPLFDFVTSRRHWQVSSSGAIEQEERPLQRGA